MPDPAEVLATHEYQDEHSVLLPYVEGKFGDEFLTGIYLKAKKQALLDRVFMTPQPITFPEFISQLHRKPMLVGLAKPTYNVVGIAWLYGVEGNDGWRKATVAYLFFREAWGKPELRSLARLGVRWWFDALNVDVLYGTTLVTNPLARKFAQYMGFHVLCTLPKFFAVRGQLQDASLSVLTRDEWRESNAKPPEL